MTTAAPAPNDVLEKVDALGPPGTPVTTPEVADGFDCTQRTVYNRLDSLVDDGVLETKKVGANSRVWWRPANAPQNSNDEWDGRGPEPSRTLAGEDTPLLDQAQWRDGTGQAPPTGEDPHRIAVEVTSTAVFDWDLVTDDVSVNAHFRDLFGYDEDDEIVGETLLEERIHPNDREMVTDRLERSFDPGSDNVYEFEFRTTRPDGSVRWVLTRGTVFFEGHGDDSRAVRVFGTGVDVTERKEAEKSLRETKERLEVALAAAGMGTWEWDLDDRTVRGDDTMMSLFELPPTDEPVPVERFLEKASATGVDQAEDVMDTSLYPGEELQEEFLLDGVEPPRWITWRGRAAEDDPSVLVGVSFDITEQKQRTRALEERTAEVEEARTRLKIAAEAGSVGLYTVNVDEDRLIGDRYVADCYDVDPDRAAEGAPVDEFVAAVHDDDTERVLREFETALTETGRLETEYRVRNEDGDVVWLLSRGTVEYDDAGNPHKLHGAISDISDRKRREQREEYLLALNDAIRPLSDPVEIQHQAAQIIGQHLDVSHAHYATVNLEDRVAIVNADYYRDGVVSVVGEHHFEDYGAWMLDALRAGETIVVDDIDAEPAFDEENQHSHEQVDIRSLVVAPLHRDGRLTGVFTVDQRRPREWTETEVEIVEETAQRTWEAVERAHVEQDLRESEERYRTLFESIDEGFCIVEVLFDEDDEPVDYRFLETNPAFEDQTGLTEAEGERMLDLEPNHEDHWFETYGRIARTGEAERFQNEAKYLGDRWYDVYAFRIGEPAERKVAVLFDDVSELKHTQQALERLTVASRELINADTETVRDRTAELVVDVLDVEYASLWQYDELSGDLSETTTALDVETDTETIRHPDDAAEQVWQAFVGDEIAVSNDMSVDETVSEGATLRSRLLIPLGRHGVVCVGSMESNVFDERVVDLAETLGATLETAWNRADSERRLQTQNEELQRLDQLNSLIREIDQALVGAGTREEINDAVCERLSYSDLYGIAWIGTFDQDDGTVRPRSWAGTDASTVETLSTGTDDQGFASDPFVTAIQTREMQVIEDVATDTRAGPWRELALKQGARSCFSIPLIYEESVYGVLVVYGTTPAQQHGDPEVLAELGGTIAHAIHAVERTVANQMDSVIELTLRTTEMASPLRRLAQATGAEIAFDGLVSGSNETPTVFFTATKVTPEALVAASEDVLAVQELVHVADREKGSLFKAYLTDPILASYLLEPDASVRSLHIDAVAATIVVDLPSSADVRQVLDDVRRDVPDIELLSRRTRTRSPEIDGVPRTAVLDRLTPRQQEVLQLAYRSGYFESPRVQTGKDIADALGIAPSTFTNHIRGAERGLLDVVFANGQE